MTSTVDRDTSEIVHDALISISRRAEKNEIEKLVETFVDARPLNTLLTQPENQLIYGRRGTGKTHALKYLYDRVFDSERCLPIYLDLRLVGSNGSLYADTSTNIPLRATRLLQDVMAAINDEVYIFVVQNIGKVNSPERVTRALDDFEAVATDVSVRGNVTRSSRSSTHSETSLSGSATATTSPSFSAGARRNTGQKHEQSAQVAGEEVPRVHFGAIFDALHALMDAVGIDQIWLLLDEWSEIPGDLQPYLADLLRKAFFPSNRVVIKISAIEYRSRFAIHHADRTYTGIEVNDDIAADINLDDFIVFDNDKERSTQFFKSLLYKHVLAEGVNQELVPNEDYLMSLLFTQHSNVLGEFVSAVEGVPRDAIHLMRRLVTKRYGGRIAMTDVRNGAREWFLQDKSGDVENEPELAELLDRIITEVIGKRKAKAFLLKSGTRDHRIEKLFNQRVIHILKKNISSQEGGSDRYDVFKLDYGCYVHLIATKNAPEGLLNGSDDVGYIDVPPEDYRSVRRAILTIGENE